MPQIRASMPTFRHFMDGKSYSNNERVYRITFEGRLAMDVAIDGDETDLRIAKQFQQLQFLTLLAIPYTQSRKLKETLTFLSTKLTELAEQRIHWLVQT